MKQISFIFRSRETTLFLFINDTMPSLIKGNRYSLEMKQVIYPFIYLYSQLKYRFGSNLFGNSFDQSTMFLFYQKQHMQSVVMARCDYSYSIIQMNNESASLCNLNLEDSDLKKLEELDPFQTDGYQSLGKVSVPVRIIYTDEKGKETIDKQILTIQILTRSYKSAPTKGKENRIEPQLDSMRLYLFSEQDIFLNMVSSMSNSTFQAVKTKNQLNLKFKDLPLSVMGMLQNCTQNGGESKNQAELRLSFEGTGKMVISQQTEYKAIELLQLYFSGSSLQKAHQSIIYRYNFNRTKLSMIQNSIDSIYKLLAVKNAPLLAYIQKSVGDSF